MTTARWYWLIRDRRTFITRLAETGDAEQAAASIGRSLGEAFLMRDRVPEFAEEWRRAMEFVVEIIESRVLGQLLGVARTLADDSIKTIVTAAKAVIDIVHKRKGAALRRPALPPLRAVSPAAPPAAPPDAPRVAKFRQELERLAGIARAVPG